MMRTLSPEAGEFAGLSVSEPSGMGASKLTNITQLLTPAVPGGEVAVSVFWLAFLMRLFGQGGPLRPFAQWCHVHPTTVLRWILGLALALWPQVNQWLATSVKMKKADVDEKWIKIRGAWYYWFVVLDGETGVPMYQELLASRSAASVSWIVTQLRRLKQLSQAVIPDGLAAYQTVFRSLDGITRILCRCHHQQGVTRWLKDHFPATADVSERKKAMKRVFQTTDKRTVRRRWARLKERAAEGALKEGAR